MTVNTTTNKITYLGDGSTTAWTFPFPGVAASNIQVFITDPNGFVTQPLPATFSVVLNPPVNPNPTSVGGTVNYPLAGPPLAVGNQITIIRQLSVIQSNSISNQSIVYPATVETEFDYLTMLDQQELEFTSRAISVPVGDPMPPPLPSIGQRKNQQAVFDSNGNMTAGGAVVGTIISPAMVPVVTAPTLTAAAAAMHVATLDSPILTGNPQAPTAVFGDSDTSIASTAFVQAALVGAGMSMTTGDLKPTHKTVADPGWILWSDGTIGDATSASSIRANADTSALFALYYNGYTDVLCPLLTSAGVATTRVAQGTAAAAFAAHCRMSLLKGSGRSIGLAGSGAGLTTRALGSTFGAEAVTMTVAQMPAHNHGTSDPSHVHGISDPSHAHSIADPTHVHSLGTSLAGTSGFVFAPPLSGGAVNMSAPDLGLVSNTAGAATGIGIFGSYTGISIGGAFTGISILNNGGGAPMNVMNPMAYVNIMIKL